MVMENIYDTVIIGGGPAGYTAALYCVRAGLSTLVLEKLSAGGQMALTSQIDNYPGFDETADGFLLAEKMQRGAERFGAKTQLSEVTSVNFDNKIKVLETSDGKVSARTVIIATGAWHRDLGLDGEKALIGKGVNYCAACDGAFYRGKDVVVVGGGNTAAADAMLLSRICNKVTVVHRRDTLSATKIYHDPLMKAQNVEFLWNTVVEGFIQDGSLTGLKLKNTLTGEKSTLDCSGLFVSIGRSPATDMFKGILELDGGYIVADESTRTSKPGVFAIGDVRTKAVRQIVTAVGDGAVASHYAEEYLAESF